MKFFNSTKFLLQKWKSFFKALQNVRFHEENYIPGRAEMILRKQKILFFIAFEKQPNIIQIIFFNESFFKKL